MRTFKVLMLVLGVAFVLATIALMDHMDRASASARAAGDGDAKTPAAAGATAPYQRDRLYPANEGAPPQKAATASAPTATTAAPTPAAAPPAPPATEPPRDAHDNRARIVQDIVASGPTRGAWAHAAPDVLGGLRAVVPPPLMDRIELGAVQCYEKACVADVSYPDLDAFEQTNPLFLRNDAFDGWPGIKGRTAPEVVDTGRVVVTWMLMNPDPRPPGP